MKRKIEHKFIKLSELKIYKIIKAFYKRIHKISEIVASFSIFAFTFYFVLGCIFTAKTDNDVFMDEIKRHLAKNEEIDSIQAVDLIGGGNESILVTSIEPYSELNNKFIIFEQITTGFFSKLNNPFGNKSNYRIEYSLKLNNDWCEIPEILWVKDICGDSTKEIAIGYDYYGSTYGSQFVLIVGYDSNSQQYKVIGSYPSISDGDTENVLYIENGKNKSVLCPEYSFYQNAFWAENYTGGESLIVCQRYKWDDKCTIVKFDLCRNQDNYLEWYEEFRGTNPNIDVEDMYNEELICKYINENIDYGFLKY